MVTPGEVRAAMWLSATRHEAYLQSNFNKGGKRRGAIDEGSVMPTVPLLKYATSKGGGEQLLRDLGHPGLGGCRAR